jgi:hypothetical protein
MRMIDDTVISGHDLVRMFGDGDSQTTAVDRVSLDLNRGQFALLMGPSGSGKSTLLAMLSGLLRPTSGRVLCRDDDDTLDIWSLNDRERERFRLKHCGYIFQGYNLFPALTARQQLEIVLRWGFGTPAREARKQSEDVLSMLGLGNKLNLLPGHWSKIRASCLPTNRPAPSTGTTASMSWSYCERPHMNAEQHCWSLPMIRACCPMPTRCFTSMMVVLPMVNPPHSSMPRHRDEMLRPR